MYTHVHWQTAGQCSELLLAPSSGPHSPSPTSPPSPGGQWWEEEDGASEGGREGGRERGRKGRRGEGGRREGGGKEGEREEGREGGRERGGRDRKTFNQPVDCLVSIFCIT